MAQSLGNQELIIYRDETEAQNPLQKFDEETILLDGRFLVKISNEKLKPQFYFRTILGKIFDNRGS